MKWTDKLAENLDRLSGEAVRKKVMKGCGKITSTSSPSEKADWVKGAMERLDESVDEATRKKIMVGCSHRFP